MDGLSVLVDFAADIAAEHDAEAPGVGVLPVGVVHFGAVGAEPGYILHFGAPNRMALKEVGVTQHGLLVPQRGHAPAESLEVVRLR